jgi:hypothetical protein
MEEAQKEIKQLSMDTAEKDRQIESREAEYDLLKQTVFEQRRR